MSAKSFRVWRTEGKSITVNDSDETHQPRLTWQQHFMLLSYGFNALRQNLTSAFLLQNFLAKTMRQEVRKSEKERDVATSPESHTRRQVKCTSTTTKYISVYACTSLLFVESFLNQWLQFLALKDLILLFNTFLALTSTASWHWCTYTKGRARTEIPFCWLPAT